MGFADESIADFLDIVATGEPTPGGGAVAAIAGAAGAALCEMVCSITEEQAEDSSLADHRSDLEQHRRRLLELANEDAKAIDELMAATQRPGDDRTDAVRTAIEDAIAVPIETAESCLAVLEAARTIVDQGYRPAVGDSHTGALLAHTALEASLHNARVNLRWLDDAESIRSTDERIKRLDRDGQVALEAVESSIETRRVGDSSGNDDAS